MCIRMKEEIAARLKMARKAAIGGTAQQAAETLGVPYQTYAGHENGNRGFDIEAAIHYAKRFKVSLDWLLTGHGRGPGGEDIAPKVKDEPAILAFLARIDGLTDNDIDLAFGVIRNALAARRAEQAPSEHRDPQQLASRRREQEPSR